MTRTMWPQLVSLALGVGLMVAPGVLDYDEPASSISWTLGPIAASVAFIAAFPIGRELRWANVAVGLCLVGAGLIGIRDAVPLLVTLFAGAAIVGLAMVTRECPDRYGGGWRSVLRSPGDPEPDRPPGQGRSPS